MDVVDTSLPYHSSFRPDTPISGSPLSPAQFAEIQSAHDRSKKLRRAMGVATVDAWLSTCFATLTLLFAMLSPWSFLLGAPLALLAFNSFRGAKLLKQFDPKAPRILAWNQAMLASLIVIYALYSLWTAASGSSELIDMATKDLAMVSMLGDLKPLLWDLSVAVYGSLIAATVIVQGLTGLYYKSRGKYLAAYLRDTPAWVVELQKKQAAA